MSNIFFIKIYFLVFSFILGACIGSFLNVIIIRWPKGESIVSPPSHCRNCQTKIPWYWNIPLLSYLLSQGKCFKCKTSFSIRYFMVELLMGCLSLALFYKFGVSWAFLFFFILSTSLVGIIFIDIKHFLIPDMLSLPLIPIGIASSFVLHIVTVSDSIVGALLGWFLFYLLRIIFFWLRKIEAIGLGDVKLIAGIGAFFGVSGVVVIIFLSAVIGLLFALISFVFKGTNNQENPEGIPQNAVPYGPSIALSAMIYMFWGPSIIKMYIQFITGTLT